MNILSLFDGISCGYVALERAGIPIDNYYACEIDKYAIQVSKANHPSIIHLGDVKTLDTSKLPKIDLLVAGFPCQSFSIAGKQKGFEDERGNLFFDLMRIFKEVKPTYFLFENVASMKKEHREKLDKIIGVESVEINSALVSAQQRKRLYWFNWQVEQPKDKGILLKDIIESGEVDRDKSLTILAKYNGTAETPNQLRRYKEMNIGQIVFDKPIYQKIKKKYEKRINDVDIDFNLYIKKQKESLSLTNKKIAKLLELPITQIEHYFRIDKSRAIPSTEAYKKLKIILHLNDDFDKKITEFETKQATFEQNLRLYEINAKSPTLTSSNNIPIRIGHFNKGGQGDRVYSVDGKSVSLSALGGGRGAKTGLYEHNDSIRKLTVTECCRLQTLEDNYCSMISNSQAYKCIGNSWTADVIAHILKGIGNNTQPKKYVLQYDLFNKEEKENADTN